MIDLIPGNDLNWPLIPQPESVGVPGAWGSKYRPMGRWSTPSCQSYEAPVIIGFFAVHPTGHMHYSTGIKKVRFIADNGTPIDVTSMEQNPDTGYFEYICRLLPTTENRAVQVRVIAYPEDGPPFIAQDNFKTTGGPPTSESCLILYSNASIVNSYSKPKLWLDETANPAIADGSEAKPYTTLSDCFKKGYNGQLDNGCILIRDGHYQVPMEGAPYTAKSRWLTLALAPGCNRENVVLTEKIGATGVRSSFRLIRLRELTIDRTTDPSPFAGASTGDKVIMWIDGSDVFGKGRIEGQVSSLKGQSCGIAYITKTNRYRARIRDWGNIAECTATHYMSGMDVNNITGDLMNVPWVRDCRYTDQRPLDGVHGDAIQFSIVDKENCMWVNNIVDNAAVQCLFMTDTLKIIRHALINNRFFKLASDGKESNFFRMRGCVHWNNTYGNQVIGVKLESRTAKDTGDPNGFELSEDSSFAYNIMGMTLNKKTLGDVVVTNENFPELVPGIKWMGNHNRRTTGFAPGEGHTLGTVKYRDPIEHDYYVLSPAAVTALTNRSLIPFDGNNNPRSVFTTKGAIEGSGGTASAAYVPVFTPEPYTYEEPVVVTLDSTGASAIYYTLNGTDPTTASTLYTGPITINTTTEVRAFATRAGLQNSRINIGLFYIDLSGAPSPPNEVQIIPRDSKVRSEIVA